MDFASYLLEKTGAPSLRAVAVRSGIEPSTLSRQLKAEPKAGTVVAICRAYGLPVIEAFTAAGFITESEAAAMGMDAGLRQATGVELARELLRRELEREAP